jgi:hypothetical protein
LAIRSVYTLLRTRNFDVATSFFGAEFFGGEFFFGAPVTPPLEPGVRHHGRVFRLRDLDHKERETTAEYLKARLRELHATSQVSAKGVQSGPTAKLSDKALLGMEIEALDEERISRQATEDEMIVLLLLAASI